MKLIVIIPALNEEKTIAEVAQKSRNLSVPGIDEIEVLVINDGSSDHTEQVIKEIGAAVITHPQTLGLGKVFTRAIHEALQRKADIMIFIDGDGQFNAHDIPQLVLPIIRGEADFVTCTRFRDRSLIPKMPFTKKCGNRFLAWFLSKATGQKLTDTACGFRAYSKEALLNLNLFGKFTYSQESLLDLIFKDFRLKEIPLKVKGRREFGQSHISQNLFRYGWQALKIILRSIRDYRALKYIGGFGMVIFLIGISLDIFVLSHFFLTGEFTPYKYLGFTGAFLNGIGIIIFVLGLVADMLNRLRMTQEKILAFEKRKYYGDGG